ncbi:MAG: PQQ-dependent sugar dehydrogenase [Proteobacteria bacterium]|nr:PQQ-dependent sugar dehydrogenase [Pseudomonadota bacterium]
MIKKILWGLLLMLVIGAAVLYTIMPTVNMPLAMFRGSTAADPAVLGERIKIPAGFRFTVFATGLRGARYMRVTPNGDVLLSLSNAGEVLLLRKDSDGNGQADGQVRLLSGLDAPHGMELLDGWLYVAEKGAIGRIKFDGVTGTTAGTYSTVLSGLPADGNHTKKALRVGPDGWLYVNVGSSCNVCIEEDSRRSTIMRVAPDGSSSEIYASGLRNSMGFDWSPEDGAMYATNNGRDLLGDDYPLEELNRIEKGKFYGWPFSNEFGDPDPDFGAQKPAGLVATNPVHTFAAHNAPLGMTFLRSGHYPTDFHHDALVALHGSWNRRQKDGYKVVRLSWDAKGAISQADFMSGFLLDDKVIGRPVDVAESADGSIYVSDDFSGSVYRLAYGEAGQSDNLSIAQPVTTQSVPPTLVSAEAMRAGEALDAANNCTACHGELASAKTAQVPLQNLAARYDQAAMVALFKVPPRRCHRSRCRRTT